LLKVQRGECLGETEKPIGEQNERNIGEKGHSLASWSAEIETKEKAHLDKTWKRIRCNDQRSRNKPERGKRGTNSGEKLWLSRKRQSKHWQSCHFWLNEEENQVCTNAGMEKSKGRRRDLLLHETHESVESQGKGRDYKPKVDEHGCGGDALKQHPDRALP